MHFDQTINEILAIRHFNRFYTKEFGFLQKRMLGSPFSLIEARVLYEIGHRETPRASDIATDLDLDPGYLSRILKKFETDGHVKRAPCQDDGRSHILALTEAGEDAVALLADIANDDIAHRLESLGNNERQALVGAMRQIEATLNAGRRQNPPVIIRSHQPGDIGWIISSQGRYYAEALGFNENFEAFVARIAADFISSYDPVREHCWIAELDGKNVGSIVLVQDPDRDATARLRLLYVDDAARGLGLGKRLVEECLRFARRAGYDRVELYTNAVLATARHIYEQQGFHLLSEDEHTTFGDPQVGQYWALDL